LTLIEQELTLKSSRELHYIYNLYYPLGIIVAMAIVVFAVKWGAIEDLVKYITFGLTLTSLFLALVAIFYAIVSNTSLSQHLGNLGNATRSVSDTTATLSRMSDMLEEKLAEIPRLIRGVELKVDQTRADIANERSTLENTESTVDDSGSSSPPIDVAKLVSFFIDKSSFGGLVALYTAQLAYRTKKPFVPEDVWKEGISEDYGYGYIVAARSAGIVGVVHHDGMMTVPEIAESLPDLRNTIDKWLEKKNAEKPAVWDIEETITEYVAPIEKYFED
jgi:hypothetical protein